MMRYAYPCILCLYLCLDLYFYVGVGLINDVMCISMYTVSISMSLSMF